MQGFTRQGQPKKIGCFPFKCTPQPRYSPDIAPSDFSFRLAEYSMEDELYEGVDKILTGFSIQMIETVFVDWMNRLRRLIDGNGGYVSQNIAGEFLN
jgi:hypothetical protein